MGMERRILLGAPCTRMVSVVFGWKWKEILSHTFTDATSTEEINENGVVLHIEMLAIMILNLMPCS
jgi:hypothetical protein